MIPKLSFLIALMIYCEKTFLNVQRSDYERDEKYYKRAMVMAKKDVVSISRFTFLNIRKTFSNSQAEKVWK